MIGKNKKLWGSRFKKPLAKEVDNFQSSIQFGQRLYKYDIIGSQAHVKMLMKQKLIGEKEGNSIIAGLDAILQDIERNKIKFNSSYEDIHMAIEQLLIEKIGDTAKKLHTARSRNDQVALDLRLFLRDEIDSIISLLQNTIDTLSNIANKNKDTVMPGYTHLQKAQPVTLSKHMGAYVSMFTRDISRFENCKKRMNFSPLGAGALAGSGLNTDRAYIAKLLKFDGIIENSMDAVSDRDYAIEFSSSSSIAMMHLSRLSEELILWATDEFNFIEIDDAYATGSSLMPNKKNPDVPELIRGKTGRVYGNLISLLTVMKSLPLTYNKDMQEDKEVLFDTIDTLKACLFIVDQFLNNISFNKEKMSQRVGNSSIWATAIVEYLVLNNVAFREAHDTVGKIVNYSLEKEIEFTNVPLVELQKFSSVFKKDIKKIIANYKI
jgi:argininosuccinate lyase